MSRSNDTLKQIEEKLEFLQETVENRLDSLTNELSLVVRGLSLMSETQGAHSDMLAEVLTACSADPGPNTELSTASSTATRWSTTRAASFSTSPRCPNSVGAGLAL